IANHTLTHIKDFFTHTHIHTHTHTHTDRETDTHTKKHFSEYLYTRLIFPKAQSGKPTPIPRTNLHSAGECETVPLLSINPNSHSKNKPSQCWRVQDCTPVEHQPK